MQDYQRVVWAEGVFLGQQHFQLWDQYHHQDLTKRQTALSPLGWGLIDLEFDEGALAAGELRVRRCEFLLPGGKLVRYRPAEGEGLALPLPEDRDQAGIFAGIPHEDSAIGITGYRDRATLCAWEVDYRDVEDQHDPSRRREVALARPNLMIVHDSQPHDQLETLKLMELARSPAGGWQVNDTFIPAVCQVGASEVLLRLLRRIEERVSARVRVLDERRRRLGAVSDFGPSDLSQFLLLQALSPAQAAPAHYMKTRMAHPETVFVELVRLIATLRTFHPEAAAAEPLAYAHDGLGDAFGACERAVAACLSDALPSPMAGLKLVSESSTLRVASAVDSEQLRRGTLFLAVRFDADDPAWVSDFARQVKVGAREDIELILGSALQGVPVVHVQRPPNRLPIKSGYEYFRLETGGEFWQRVVDHQSLALFMPKAFTAAHIDVLTVEE